MSLGANPLAAIARSKRIATKLSKQLPLEELEKAIDHLKSALEVSKQRERDKVQIRQKAVVEKVSALLEEAGLTPSDLQGKRLKNKMGASKRKPSAKKNRPQERHENCTEVSTKSQRRHSSVDRPRKDASGIQSLRRKRRLAGQVPHLAGIDSAKSLPHRPPRRLAQHHLAEFCHSPTRGLDDRFL